MKPPYTSRQGQFLAFIHHYTTLHRRPPAEAEMVEFFHVTPPSVHQMILTLERRGLITRTPGIARSINLRLPPEQLEVLVSEQAGPSFDLLDGTRKRSDGSVTAAGEGRRQTAQESRAIIERLKPEEASVVLHNLLSAHPELIGEAIRMARTLLSQEAYEDIAVEVEGEVRELGYEELNERAGRHEWGYTEPSEAAWEILEETLEPFLDDLTRHLELGLADEAREICQGIVLGCYRLSEQEGGDVLSWAPDFPAEAAGNALEIWYGESGGPENCKSVPQERPPLSADFLSQIPNWIPMLERTSQKKNGP